MQGDQLDDRSRAKEDLLCRFDCPIFQRHMHFYIDAYTQHGKMVMRTSDDESIEETKKGQHVGYGC